MALLTGFYRRCGVLGLIALGLLTLGSLTLIRALANRGGISTDCATFLADKPQGKWISLSDCVVTRILSVPRTTVGGKPTEVFIPVRAASSKSDREIHLLLASSASSDLEFVKMANEQSSTSSGRGLFHSSYRGQLEEIRSVEGRLLRGLDLPDRERARLSKTFPALAQDFVIIEMKERPGMGLPLALLAISAICGVITGFVQLRRRMPMRHTFAEGGIAVAAK